MILYYMWRLELMEIKISNSLPYLFTVSVGSKVSLIWCHVTNLIPKPLFIPVVDEGEDNGQECNTD